MAASCDGWIFRVHELVLFVDIVAKVAAPIDQLASRKVFQPRKIGLLIRNRIEVPAIGDIEC